MNPLDRAHVIRDTAIQLAALIAANGEAGERADDASLAWLNKSVTALSRRWQERKDSTE